MTHTVALPFHIDPTGSVAKDEHPANQLTNRVFSVIATQPGQRIMRPVYGTNLGQFLFGTGGQLVDIDGYVQGADAQDMSDVARAAISMFEPGAVLDRLRITQMPDDNGVMRVECMYRPSNPDSALNPNVIVKDWLIGTVSAGTFTERPGQVSKPWTDIVDGYQEYRYQEMEDDSVPDENDGVIDNDIDLETL